MSFSRLPSRPPRASWGLSYLALAALSVGPAVPAADLPLHPGSPLDREIRIGDVHRYPIELATGQFLDAFVEQGIDIQIELLDPSGEVVVGIDSPNATRDVEELAFVADQTGPYELRVTVASDQAPAGNYRIRLDPLRTAGEPDRLRMEAVLATQAAIQEMVKKKISWERQLAARERALTLWRKVGDQGREAEETYQLGILKDRLGQLEQAAALHRKAADLWQTVQTPAKRMFALNELGRALSTLSRSEEALQTLGTALSLAREEGDLELQGKVLNNRGHLLLNNFGKARDAQQDLEEALRLARASGACPGSILVNLGSASEDLSDPNRAIRFYKEALETKCDVQTVHAAALNNLGVTHDALGNWEEALKYYTLALDLNSTTTDRGSEAATRNNLALAHQKLGHYEEALESYEKALELAGQTGNREVQVTVLFNLGSLHLRNDRQEEAIRHWEQVPELAAGAQGMELLSLQAQAFVQREKGELAAARATLERAREAARSRSSIALQAELAMQLAKVQRRQQDLETAAKTAEAALDLVESFRSRVGSRDLSTLFLASRQDYYELAIDILMELQKRRPGKGFDARALRVSERARARSLLDLLSEAGADIQKGADPKLIQLERDRRAAVRTLDRRHLELLHQGADPEQLAEAKRKLQEALEEYDQVQEDLRTSGRLYASLTQPQPLSAAEIQQQVLGERALLLEYALGKEKSYLWAVTSTSLRSFELPGRKEIEEPARSFYQAVAAHDSTPAGASLADRRKAAERAEKQAASAALELSRLILAEVEPLLGDRVLLVVADGMLQYVPFAALPLPASPAELVRNEVVVLPSASMLAVQRRELAGRRAAPKTLAVFADPLFQGHPDLPHLRAASKPKGANHRGTPDPVSQSENDPLDLAYLPFSREEADQIALLVVPDQQWKALGADASVANATSEKLKDYRYVHFATHGILDAERPELSKLALSQFDQQGKPLEDGFLRLQEIYNLELDADLVVLSACETALGKEIRGEGLVGLTRGFLYAGSSRVLASLWKVEDKATSLLMQRFYDYLLVQKKPPAAALRLAQADIASKPRYRSPYYWAGFSLQGEWK